MRSKAVRHAGRCIGLVALTGVPMLAPGLAQAQEVRTGLIASTGLSVETNPYNASDSSNAEFAANAELRPSLTVQDALTQVSIRGSAQFRQFLHRYGLEDNYSVDAEIVSKRSERVTLRGSGLFAYSEGGFAGYGRPGLIASDPLNSSPVDPAATTPDTSLQNSLNGITDVNLIGTRTRLTSLASNVGVDYLLSPRSSLSADFNARALRYQSALGSDYNTLGGELRFSHQFDEYLSVGVIGGYDRTNYLDPNQGDAGVISALLSVDRKFGERWSASVALGASFTNIDGRLGQPDTHFTALTGRVRFCRQGEFTRFCVAGDRSPQPSINGNVRVTTNINADYSWTLAARQRLTLSAAYARTGSSHSQILTDPAVDFATGTARYDNDFNKKLTGFVSASVSKIYSSIAPRTANISGAIGIQVHLGNPQ
ncbi:MAG: hypothetical protein J0I47_11600 [Sphingomonas sp.]|uniref:hypothetical protein n=1 Tax=Sphingomonas sp. TaxID=28214 RepID=UPI001AD3679C|nr:hypothetical protein [Sphingomonas sp.]MBN8808858.1 hypothetical protein [Sphingomonas sp.]